MRTQCATLTIWLITFPPAEIIYDIAIMDMRGQYLCALSGFTVARHYQIPIGEVATRYELVTQPYNIPAKPPISSKSVSRPAKTSYSGLTKLFSPTLA